MKRKSIGIGIIVAIIVVAGISLLIPSAHLGNISGNYTELTTLNSEVSFSSRAGDKIKFSFRSNVKSGDLDIILYDSEGNALFDLGKADKLETFFTLDKSDTYTLVAMCNSFIGDFKIKVSPPRQLDLFWLNFLGD